MAWGITNQLVCSTAVKLQINSHAIKLGRKPVKSNNHTRFSEKFYENKRAPHPQVHLLS